jgi:hypothetical protein
LTQSSDHKYQVADSKLQDVLKVAEDDPVRYQILLDSLDKMKKDFVAQTIAAQAASSKDTTGSTTGGQSGGLQFAETGAYKHNNAVKRKKGAL